MKYIIDSNWSGWDNAQNLKGTTQELTDEQVQHLKDANVKLIPVVVETKAKKNEV